MGRITSAVLLAGLIVAMGLAASAAPSAAAQPAVTVSIQNAQYSPATVTIKAGQTVLWTNNDDRDHTVVAADGSFKSGNIGPGQSFTHTFGKPGRYKYACSYHPRMKGEVVVSE